ncbi:MULTISPECIES: tripartite tricarboxylate transporter substrate binding protein [Brevibacillus]|uniref:Bug family tripartite tricarboxylate transporter substrate binding protein n=1 Tax=Brevibacillus TaxID=55080 RepID=UPI0020400839|nr:MULTISPECIES: tripartite tricarboxylate transporter substrate binding protein [Brevibacillus]MCM3078300.1 tripartite tricarboxylate transporter substrate binding protein [Brevibacillus invocatus]MCM3428545.1 tripartite tricarboxylate transporter substrate binding protein [Brevibacillus invocatus]MDH4616918.1 tripartite tricarboxylate transporter substrate binding protein [Brevibacillus sp. AY1]
MFKQKKRSLWKKGAALCLLTSMLLVSACSSGQGDSGQPQYPTRQIEGIVPFGAGGGTDLVARAIATVAEKQLGQSINITNKPGATGTVGTKYVFDKEADGNTLLFAAENPTVYGVLQLSERSFEEFYPVHIMGRGLAAITVNESSKYKTMTDLMNDVKANPADIKMGTTGPGGLSYMVTAMISQSENVEFNMVPFDGEGPIVTALLGNHIDVSIVSLSKAIENAKGGKVRVLAVVNDAKVEELPDVPAITDELPAMSKYMPWGPFYGVWVKKEAPDYVKQTLEKTFAEASKDADYQALLKNLAIIPMGISGEEAEKFWREQQSISAWLLQDAGAAKVSPETLNIPKKQ